MKPLRFLIAVGFLGLAGAAAALPESATDRLASGPLVHSNSRDGQPIVRADGVQPGDERSGRVTITNGGSAGALYLVAHPVTGPLGERLETTIAEAGGATVASGSLDDLSRCTPLGTYAAGESRTYVFTVAFPRGDDDNDLAGATAGVDFEWVESSGAECRRVPQAGSAQEGVRVGDLRLAIAPGPYRFASRTGTARVGVRCLASGTAVCRGRLELERWKPGQGRGIAMAAGTFSVRRGAQKTITLELNRRARRRVKGTGSVAVRARVTARDATGRRRTATYRDRLLYGAARRK